jgi:hypothetical protein
LDGYACACASPVGNSNSAATAATTILSMGASLDFLFLELSS